MKYNLRYIAQIIIEADTPINLSSGEQDSLTDSLVMTDANGLPMLPGTSLTGVLKHSFRESKKTTSESEKSIFGYQGNGNDGRGSRLIVSNAHFIGKDGVVEGLVKIDWNDEFYQKFKELPIRDHAKIDHKGVAENHGKFDNQVVYKGTRFKFEMEFISNESDNENWKQLLNLLSDDTFRIGGGTRKGYGKLKIVEINTKTYNLENDEINEYLEKSSNLSESVGKTYPVSQHSSENWDRYELELTPEDFYSFGSGFGDDEVDMIPVSEDIIEWKGNTPEFKEKKILIPASSIKGAISHRTAFHYNSLTGNTIEKITENIEEEQIADELKKVVGENNIAVKELFGFAKNSKKKDADTEEEKKGQRGNVIFSDLFIDNNNSEKILNHVAIDRFTGGGRDGALFDEKVITQKDKLQLHFFVNKQAFKEENIQKAFEKTLKDITNGMLPLGGSTMRGHGSFTGSVKRNNEVI